MNNFYDETIDREMDSDFLDIIDEGTILAIESGIPTDKFQKFSENFLRSSISQREKEHPFQKESKLSFESSNDYYLDEIYGSEPKVIIDKRGTTLNG